MSTYTRDLKLNDLIVFRDENINSSKYIVIDRLPSILTYGKHVFTLAQRSSTENRIKPNSEILFEFKDSEGKVIYSDLTGVSDTNGAVFAYVWLQNDPLKNKPNPYSYYDEILDGDGTLTIVYELENVPSEWEGKYNGRSTFSFDIRKNFPNLSPIFFQSSSLIQQKLNISESLELDKNDINYKRSYINISSSNMETYGGKVDFGEIYYRERQ